MPSPSDACGWVGDFATLVATDAAALANELHRAFSQRGSDQFEAWASSLEILRNAASRCMDAQPAASEFAAILEYRLPRDDRRPDVIVLENGTVVVIEFKEGARPASADIDQVSGYARDLRHYHSACRERVIVPFLVPVGYRGPTLRHEKGVVVTSPDRLPEEVLAVVRDVKLRRPDPIEWLRGEYAPLPGLVAAARLIFDHQPLPRIKRAAAAGIPDACARLGAIATEARGDGDRRLVLLAGVPGSGKTLVGLQLVHAEELEELVPPERRGAAPGVFLSGNGPLVEVLQKSLGSKDFVQSLKDFLEYHVLRSEGPPVEHVLVFDEAQRAWDAKKVGTKHRRKLGVRSEPELLLTIADRIPQWCMVLALVGEGQEIHIGEEGGLALWAEALAAHEGWRVHAPPRLVDALAGFGVESVSEPTLDLDTSLRSHVAGDLHRWVSRLLDGELEEARSLVPRLEGFDLYVTRDLEAARRYVHRLYAGRADRRFGLLASSCAENLLGFVRRIPLCQAA